MNIEIRKIGQKDYTSLCQLFKQADEPHLSWHPELFKRPDGPPRSKEEISQFISANDRDILAAWVGEKIAGSVSLIEMQYPNHPLIQPVRYVTIDNAVVDLDFRRLGIGQALVKAAQTWANKRGIQRLELNVYEKNVGAAAFYQQLGFEPIRTRLFLEF